MEAPPRIELGMAILQTAALPLGYGALEKNGAGDGARTRHLRLGKAALYQMSYSRILNFRTAHGIIMLRPADHLQKVPIGYSLQMERVMGLEPTISAWKANVLPLHYTRI